MLGVDILENSLMKEEWINGVVMMSPRPAHNHMKIQRELAFALQAYFRKSCEVAIEEALYLTKENVIELKKDFIKLRELTMARKAELVPDIAIYCDKNQIFKKGFLGVPQLIVEVLSPSNSEDDTIKKKEIYRKYGIPEYWIVSPITKTVYVYILNNSHYELVGEYNFMDSTICSTRFSDLIVDIRDIELYEDESDN